MCIVHSHAAEHKHELDELDHGQHHERGDGDANDHQAEAVLDAVAGIRLHQVIDLVPPVHGIDEGSWFKVSIFVRRENTAPPVFFNGQDEQAREEDRDGSSTLQVEVQHVHLVI
eukprot:CAMPEP_0170486862 /NCGR_PEP_ID=MMETSP0208-20121228/5789_1 /TAXON_ID=197538 /ORGANISM="Strombidium inclinatum, Strain S3" /LENGTH=113 /DNA_ID=CAMNT_0010760941 /DNA_START=440 /DNA_END=781 /DNA_ORIENTATION=+